MTVPSPASGDEPIDLEQIAPPTDDESHAIGFKDPVDDSSSVPRPSKKRHEPEESSGDLPDFDPASLMETFAVAPPPPQVEVIVERRVSLIPELFSEIILPLALVVVGLGITCLVAGRQVLTSNNPVTGFILLGVSALLLVVVVMPIVMRGVEFAAKSFDFSIADSHIMQTLGLVAVPVAGLTYGYFNGGVSTMISLGLFALVGMIGVVVLVYRAGVVKALVSGLIVAGSFLFSGAIGAAAVWLLAFGLTKAGMQMPWQEKKVETVAAVTAPAPVVAAPVEVKPVVVAPAPELPKPVEVAPPPPVEVKPVWTASADAPPSAERWLTDIHHLLDVRPPVTVIHAANGGPFVAIVDRTSTSIHDLRNGRRVGYIKESLPTMGAMLSPDGSILLINRTSGVRGMMSPSAPGELSNGPALELWSPSQAHMVRHITLDPSRPMPVPVAITRRNQLLTTSTVEGKPILQAWDCAGSAPAREISLESACNSGTSLATSPGGRFVAHISANKLQVHDLEDAKLAGEIDIPESAGPIRAVSYSRDGSKLAMLATPSSSPRLLVCDMSKGEILSDVSVSIVRSDQSNDQLCWTPNGGLLIGSDWIEPTTGAVICRLAPQQAGASEGRPMLMISDYHALVEFQPAGNSERVIYKAVALPRLAIDAAIGPAIRQAASAAAAPSTAESTAIAAAPGSTEATTQAAPAAAVTGGKEWVVTVLNVSRPDVNALGVQSAAEQAKLRDLQTQLLTAQQKASRMNQIKTEYDAAGRSRRIYLHSASDRSDANEAVSKLQESVRETKGNVARLDKKRDELLNTRTVTGKLADGTMVQITATGPIPAQQADTLQPAGKYKITGVGRLVDGVLNVVLRGATVVE